MKRIWGLKLLALFLAMVAAVIIVRLGATVALPHYTAQTILSIDWSLLPMSLMDKSKDEVPKIRADTIPRLIRPDMSRMAGHFCSVQGKPASSVPILTKEFTRLLKVSLTKSNGDQDQLTVQFRDNDGSVAVAVTQDVASQIKEFVKTEIGKKMENDVLKPYRENKAKLEQQEALKERINQLSQIEPLTAEVAQQIRTCQIQLNGLGQIEQNQDIDGLGLMAIVSPDPVRIDRSAAPTRRGPAYGIFVVTIAAGGGVAVWFLVSVLASTFSRNKRLPPILENPPVIAP